MFCLLTYMYICFDVFDKCMAKHKITAIAGKPMRRSTVHITIFFSQGVREDLCFLKENM